MVEVQHKLAKITVAKLVTGDKLLGKVLKLKIAFCGYIQNLESSVILSLLYVGVYGPGFDSASNRKQYQEHFLGVKAAGA
jgi:hypothetical protein